MGLSTSADPEAVMGRRRQLAAQLGFDLERALMTVQEHGANVVTFHRRRPEGGQCVFSTDALATDVPGQAIVTYHADCFPLLFADTRRGVVAGAHAGWRGALAGVATQTVQAMHLARCPRRARQTSRRCARQLEPVPSARAGMPTRWHWWR